MSRSSATGIQRRGSGASSYESPLLRVVNELRSKYGAATTTSSTAAAGPDFSSDMLFLAAPQSGTNASDGNWDDLVATEEVMRGRGAIDHLLLSMVRSSSGSDLRDGAFRRHHDDDDDDGLDRSRRKKRTLADGVASSSVALAAGEYQTPHASRHRGSSGADHASNPGVEGPGLRRADSLLPEGSLMSPTRRALLARSGALMEGSGPGLLSSPLALLGGNRRRRSGLGSSSHAVNLLTSAPHLRFLTSSAADMRGGAGAGSSNQGGRNFFSALFSQGGGAGGVESEAGMAQDGAGGGVAGSFSASAADGSDYAASVMRNLANHRAASELASLLRVLGNELSMEEFATAENETFTVIFALVHSADGRRRLAGVAALHALIGVVASADEEKKGIKFASNISHALKTSNVDYEFLSAVSLALGKMARGSSNVDYTESEVMRALEWLQMDRSDRRLAACLNLTELARNAPTVFYSKTTPTSTAHVGANQFIDHIFPVLRDPHPIVRVCAADALGECLRIVMDRRLRSTTGLLCKIYGEMIDGFYPEKRPGSPPPTTAKSSHSGPTLNGTPANIPPNNGGSTTKKKEPRASGRRETARSAKATAAAEAAQHASLLVASDMIRHTGDFMLPRFDEVCAAVLALADHPRALIRLEVIRLVPRLARRCPGVFGRRYLESSLDFLISSARTSPAPRAAVDIRPAAFFSLGKLAIAMREGDFGSGVSTLSQGAPQTSTVFSRLCYVTGTTQHTSSGDKAANGTSNEPLHKARDYGFGSQVVFRDVRGIDSRLDDIFDLVRFAVRRQQGGAGVGVGVGVGVGAGGSLSASSSTPAAAAGSKSLAANPGSGSGSVGGVGGGGGGPSDLTWATRLEALHCGADLVRALGAQATPYTADLLNDMINSGLSDDLIYCLYSIADCLPQQQAFIQERLLQEISHCLAGTREAMKICDPMNRALAKRLRPGLHATTASARPTEQPTGIVSTPKQRSSSTATRDDVRTPAMEPRDQPLSVVESIQYLPQVTINTSSAMDDVEALGLSLRTLGSFGANSQAESTGINCATLLPFVHDVVSQYLSHPSEEVRKEAASSCCLLLLPPNHDPDKSFVPPGGRTKGNAYASLSLASLLRLRLGSSSGKLMEDVLQNLLQVAVSDPSPLVRHRVVWALDDRYDIYLCQSQHIPPLFLLLQDEVLPVRAGALRLIGRLARINPGPILPSLRRLSMELIVELRCGSDGGGREAATRLLVSFLRAEPLHRLIHPFLPSLIEALPLKNPSPRLESAALEALGELARVSGAALVPWLDRLIPHILDVMQDQSSASKQRLSFRTLGLITGNTGYVISPYVDYPQLMPLAANILPGTKRAPWSLRREVIRTLGLLGAVDPDRYQQVGFNALKGGGSGGGYFVDSDEDEVSPSRKLTSASSVIVGANQRKRGMTAGASVDALQAPIVGSSSNGLVAPREAVPHVAATENKVLTKKFGRAADDDEPAHKFMYEQYAMTAQPVSNVQPSRRLTPVDSDFYPTVAVQALTRILKDPSQSTHHGMVMQALMFVFNSLGLRCVPFLKNVVPHTLDTIRSCAQASLREALLQQVANLSGIVREHLRPYLPFIFVVVEEYWNSRHLAPILSIVEKVAVGVPDDFRRYVPRLVPLLLSTMETINVSDWASVSAGSAASISMEHERLQLALRSVQVLSASLGEYLHLLVPDLVNLTDALLSARGSTNNYSNASILAVEAVRTLSVLLQEVSAPRGGPRGGKDVSIAPSSSLPARAAQPLLRILRRGTSEAAGIAIVDALCACARQLGNYRWMPFFHEAAVEAIRSWHEKILREKEEPPVPNRRGAIEKQPEPVSPSTDSVILYEKTIREMQASRQHPSYRNTASDVLVSQQPAEGAIDNIPANRDHYMSVPGAGTFSLIDASQDAAASAQAMHASTHQLNQVNLQRAWDVSQRSTREDWDEWMRRFAVQLLREAPSPSLRATAGLAHVHPPLARELFSAAFACCWSDLSEQYRANLIHSLEVAFDADVSPEILQTLLNLAEFMEQDGVEGGLPIDITVLAKLALKCRSYAKALHYKEKERQAGGGSECIEDLISINMKLDLPEAALGVLKSAQADLERLGTNHWNDVDYSLLLDQLHDGFSSEYLQHHSGLDLAYSVTAPNSDVSSIQRGKWVSMEMQESWLAQLGSWSEALAMYEKKLQKSPNDVETIVGCMRCLDARGEWRKVIDIAESSWDALYADGASLRPDKLGSSTALPLLGSSRSYRKALKYCAQAAWRLGRWDDLEKYASKLVNGEGSGPYSVDGVPQLFGARDDSLPRVDYDGAFFSAVLHIHRREWSLALNAIDAARGAMEGRFTALMAESYKRAYPSMLTAQVLAEMEEIVSFGRLEDRAKADEDRHPANRPDEEEARRKLVAVWRTRLSGCRVDSEVHSTLLGVRSLVLGPADDVQSTLTLSTLSRQAQCFKLAERVLLDPLNELGADRNGPVFGFRLPGSLSLGLQRAKENILSGDGALGIDGLVTGEPRAFVPNYGGAHKQYCQVLVREGGGVERLEAQHRLYYAYTKHLWATGQSVEAQNRLAKLCDVVDLCANCERSFDAGTNTKCWLKLAEWKGEALSSPAMYLQEASHVDVLIALKRAIASGSGYRTWHAWALTNFRLASHLDGATFRGELSTTLSTPMRRSMTSAAATKTLRNHVVAAVEGFVKAICYGTKRWSASVQQDMLNLLTCLFKYGEAPEVTEAIKSGIDEVTLESWLGVLPQLLARIHFRSPAVRSVLHPLLVRLGAKHPQALMYPLSVLLKSPVAEQKEAAEILMKSLKSHSYGLVEEALMVSSELIRVAILWLELWHGGLEDASRLYYGEGNVSGMLGILLPLHEQIEQGATTRKEQDFIRNFGRDLAEAHAFLNEYVRLTTRNGGEIPSEGGFSSGQGAANDSPALAAPRNSEEAEAALHQAWDLYYTVFRQINKQLPMTTTLELSQCSPALMNAHNLELGVPGSYRVDGSYVNIESFVPRVQVITSKQRPRKIFLRGSDGNEYVFLLKGHEDLRQDERVMQLFGLVNALLARDRRTNNQDLNIQRYAIAPLSHDCGVVGWVPHCDTFHSLIRDYREAKAIPLNLENREMVRIAPDYDMLTVMQKVEVFSEALDRTEGKGNDLYEVLWMKSTNSEQWLDRRTMFTRSLAVMSMVGYILGLGDRHPSNLMLDQISGRVLHIDFGDCFEVAMHREKYPEKIPFRLTRMLIKAMEVSGIEGSYRSTSECTMSVLRDNRDSLVAMLEAFVYDPLISWRLLGQGSEASDVEGQGGKTEGEAFKAPVNSGGINMFGAEAALMSGMAHMSVRDPIQEGPDEDDGDEEGDNGGGISSSQRNDGRQVLNGDATASLRSAVAAAGERSESVQHRSAASIRSARSMQMHSEIQALAANLGASGRIASVVGDAADRVALEGSIAKSRLDRSLRQREALSFQTGTAATVNEDALNLKAVRVIRRVEDKLRGTDFSDPDDLGAEPLDVRDQVQRLIVQATLVENLCQLYIGWCAFW